MAQRSIEKIANQSEVHEHVLSLRVVALDVQVAISPLEGLEGWDFPKTQTVLHDREYGGHRVLLEEVAGRCELPGANPYGGSNVRHGRKLLEDCHLSGFVLIAPTFTGLGAWLIHAEEML